MAAEDAEAATAEPLGEPFLRLEGFLAGGIRTVISVQTRAQVGAVLANPT
jgi:hypothetical protein